MFNRRPLAYIRNFRASDEVDNSETSDLNFQEVATSTQSMYSDSGDDSCDEKMMLTIETMQAPDSEEKLVMIRPGLKMEADHIDS